ncbi:Large T antigen [Trichinella spiralis]|uniref:Large T antigen n=1 Tax=Trichinella spiralis TaxID=6334 RepID=A0ABR3KDX1_TRISP
MYKLQYSPVASCTSKQSRVVANHFLFIIARTVPKEQVHAYYCFESKTHSNIEKTEYVAQINCFLLA